MKKSTLIANKKHPKTGKIIVRGSFDNSNKTLTELYQKQHYRRVVRSQINSESRRRNVGR